MSATAIELSIVIPVYGSAELTRHCLDSLSRHAPPVPYEIIIVDDASPDPETVALLTELKANSHCRVHRQAINGGFAKACNCGIELSQAPLVLLLNSDTEVLEGWSEPLLRAMAEPSVGAAGSLLLYPGGRVVQHAGVELIRRKGRLRCFHRGQYWLADHLPWLQESQNVIALTGACILLRKDALPGGTRLDEGYINGYEDIDLCLRLGQAGWILRYCADSHVIHCESISEGRFAREGDNQARFWNRWNAALPIATSPQRNWETIDKRARREYLLDPVPRRASKVLRMARISGNPLEITIWEQLAKGAYLPWMRIGEKERQELHERLGFDGLKINQRE